MQRVCSQIEVKLIIQMLLQDGWIEEQKGDMLLAAAKYLVLRSCVCVRTNELNRIRPRVKTFCFLFLSFTFCFR